MNAPREMLLHPTLGTDAPPTVAPYSVQATFFTGFFGGPFAAIALIALNSQRLQRLGRDWPMLAACVIVAIAVGWAIHGSAPAVLPVQDWLTSTLGESSARFVHRFVALGIVGVGYWLHRREQRNTDVMGLSRPNGWLAGGLCIIGGGAVLTGLIAVVIVSSR